MSPPTMPRSMSVWVFTWVYARAGATTRRGLVSCSRPVPARTADARTRRGHTCPAPAPTAGPACATHRRSPPAGGHSRPAPAATAGVCPRRGRPRPGRPWKTAGGRPRRRAAAPKPTRASEAPRLTPLLEREREGGRESWNGAGRDDTALDILVGESRLSGRWTPGRYRWARLYPTQSPIDNGRTGQWQIDNDASAQVL